ncbi:hypothetical protein ACQ7HM_20950 [Williamsia sp. MIQD14]|uniref:hypothetical protein n=1 Tax=Williamsia sp. MIQD14 TaxID=3425703 RepID=UPI003DA06147
MKLRSIVSVLAQTASQHGWSTTLRLAFLMVVVQSCRLLAVVGALVWWWPPYG